MNTRLATKKDIPHLSILMLDEFRKPPWNEKATLKAVQKSLTYYLETGKTIVALSENEIIGMLVFRLDEYWQGPVISIEDMAVKGYFKGQRVAKMLLDELEKYAKRRNAKRIILITNRKSKAAKFYRLNGFEKKKRIVYLEKRV